MLAGREIQGNVIPGFNKDHVRLLFLRFDDPDAAKRWIRQIYPYVATAREVWDFNRLFKLTKSRRGFEGTVKATWVNVAFSYGGLKKLVGEKVNQFADEAFRDTASRSGADWVVGRPGGEVDVVVIIAADDPVDLDAATRLVRDDIYARDRDITGVHVVFEQGGAKRQGAMRDREHFGWSDGVSQPGLRGRFSEAPEDVLTRRESDDPNQGLPGQDLIWPGEFVFGYSGQHRHKPVEAEGPDSLKSRGKWAAPSWAKNGSYLVFRRLRQDVGAFHRFLYEEGRRHGVRPEAFGARLVGRWPGGAPLVLTPITDDPALGGDKQANNDFEFGPADDDEGRKVPRDPDGRLCPFSAHIRKTYPRDETVAPGDLNPYRDLRPEETLNESDTQTHRLLRRGIPYGPSSDSTPEKPVDDAIDRGLLFMAYMTSIEEQFEFVSRRWLNDADFKRPATGVDPILGQVAGTDKRGSIKTVLPNQANIVEIGLEEWVATTGGGYFFAPSISALQHLAT
jgi:Dyp-type peroxidase family